MLYFTHFNMNIWPDKDKMNAKYAIKTADAAVVVVAVFTQYELFYK